MKKTILATFALAMAITPSTARADAIEIGPSIQLTPCSGGWAEYKQLMFSFPGGAYWQIYISGCTN